MMKLFRRYILGGKSDKTEGTLLAFLIGVAWMTAIIVLEALEFDMSKVIEPVGWYLAATVGAFTGATTAHHLFPGGHAHPPPQGGPEGYPEGDYPPEDWPAGQPAAGAPRSSGREVYPE
jgi:hypothetical protein